MTTFVLKSCYVDNLIFALDFLLKTICVCKDINRRVKSRGGGGGGGHFLY